MSQFRFTVDKVFRLPSRSYALAVGTVDEGIVEMGVACELRTPQGDTYPGTIESIEIHNAPGAQAIGVGGLASDHLIEGSSLTSVAAT